MDFLRKINEFLQKSGMLRYGSAKGIYKNAKDAPDEIIPGYEYKSLKKIDKEFNSEKGSSEKGEYKGKVLFWATLVVAVIFGLIFLMTSGFGVWFIVFLIAWFFYLKFIWDKVLVASISVGKVIGFGVLMIIFSFVVLSISMPDDNKSDSGSTKSKIDIGKLKKYDGQVINISSLEGKLEGVAVLAVPENGSLTRPLKVEYYINIIEDLSVNEKCFECESNPKYDHDCRSYDKYNYAGNLYGAVKGGDFNFYNQVYPVFCDKFKDPLSADSSSSGMIMGCFDKQAGKDLVTNKFYYYQWATYESYEQFLDNNKLSIHDAENYITRNSCVDGKVGSSREGMEAGEAVKKEDPVVDFVLQFSESK